MCLHTIKRHRLFDGTMDIPLETRQNIAHSVTNIRRNSKNVRGDYRRSAEPLHLQKKPIHSRRANIID